MTGTRTVAIAALLLGSAAAHADPCKLTLESNDQMQFSARELAVSTECTEVELTLRHVGRLPPKVMGHDWVLARDADVAALVSAGLAAGFDRGFLPQNDARVLAATHLVGGGESATVRFSTAALVPGGQYSFFCTSPGHSSMMRGRFLFGEAGRLAQAGRIVARP